MYVFLCRYASFSVPQMLRFGNCLLINSPSYVYLCRCSPRLLMPSLDSDSFIKINCDWWGTCNRLFPTAKQIIDDSLFSVTDYCWVYFGVRVFCIGEVIVMLSSDLAWMYALIKKVITNHNMWSIFSTNVSLRLQSYFRLFLLRGHLEVIRAMNIWTRYIGGYIQECTVLCVKALDSLYTFSISRGHFFLWNDIWN